MLDTQLQLHVICVSFRDEFADPFGPKGFFGHPGGVTEGAEPAAPCVFVCFMVPPVSYSTAGMPAPDGARTSGVEPPGAGG